jgi:hypothetical protein
MKRNDTLWKGIIQDLFDDFIPFFYGDAVEAFDLSKECQFLDKELEQICPGADIQDPKFIDKLIKIYTLSDLQKCMMLHVEVQDQKVTGFEERMYTYYYRIADRHKLPVAALVILTGTNSQFKPEGYRTRCLDTTLSYDFRIYRIADQQEEALLSNDNPFAFVILTVLLAQKIDKLRRKKNNRKDDKQLDEELLSLKLQLAEHLLDRKLPLAKQQTLFCFLKLYTPFKTIEYSNLFDNKVLILTNKTNNMYDNMGIKEIIIEQARQDGLKKGEKKAKSSIVQSLLEQTDLSVDKIASIVGIRETQVQRLKKSVKYA